MSGSSDVLREAFILLLIAVGKFFLDESFQILVLPIRAHSNFGKSAFQCVLTCKTEKSAIRKRKELKVLMVEFLLTYRFSSFVLRTCHT